MGVVVAVVVVVVLVAAAVPSILKAKTSETTKSCRRALVKEIFGSPVTKH